MKRRLRTIDSLACPAAIRSILTRLKRELPAQFPALEADQIACLNALRYAQIKAPKRTPKGRPSPWEPALLASVSDTLQRILAQETAGRVASHTFICQYLPLLDCPAEVMTGLSQGQINRQEALSLTRLSAARLRTTEEQASQVRNQILRSHLLAQGSQNQLRQRVQEILGERPLLSRETLSLGVIKADALLAVDADDVKHIFFETIKDLFYALRELEPEDLHDDDIAAVMQAADSLSNTIRSINQRKVKQSERRQTQTGHQERSAFANPVQLQEDPSTGVLIYQFPSASKNPA